MQFGYVNMHGIWARLIEFMVGIGRLSIWLDAVFVPLIIIVSVNKPIFRSNSSANINFHNREVLYRDRCNHVQNTIINIAHFRIPLKIMMCCFGKWQACGV